MSLMTVTDVAAMGLVYESVRIDGLVDPSREIDAVMLPVRRL